ncbi:MAG: hypothetical protein R2762_16475 [Bryobacteraceae bacterium]
MHVFERSGHYSPPASPEVFGGNLAGFRAGRRLRIAARNDEEAGRNEAGAAQAARRGSTNQPAARARVPDLARGFGRVAGPRPADGVTTTTRTSFSQTSEGPAGTHTFEQDHFVSRSADEIFVQNSVRESYTRASAIAPVPEPEPAPVEVAATPVEPAPVEATPVEPAPVEAAPAAPNPKPAPVEAAPVPVVAAPEPKPTPAEAAPVEAAPVEATPVEATPVEAAPAEPAVAEPAPAPEPAPPPAFSRSFKKETSFEIVTGEGDHVSIALSSSRRVERSSTADSDTFTRVNQRTASFSVEGDLNDSELSDIRKLVGGFDFRDLQSLASYRYSSTVTHQVTRGSLSISA